MKAFFSGYLVASLIALCAIAAWNHRATSEIEAETRTRMEVNVALFNKIDDLHGRVINLESFIKGLDVIIPQENKTKLDAKEIF